MIIYTAIFGEYDELRDPPERYSGCEFVCFTDDHEMRSDIWDIVYTERERSPTMMARMHKHNPHELFPNHDVSLWVDGKLQLMHNPIELLTYLGDSDMATIKHPERDCIYAEQLACLNGDKGEPDKMEEQISAYRHRGYPSHNGLVETAFLLRRHHRMAAFSNAWWDELERHSSRDQLSFNFVAWLHGFKWVDIPCSIKKPTDDRWIDGKLYFKFHEHFDFHYKGDEAYHAGDRKKAVELWERGAAYGNEQCKENLEWSKTW